ncbi:MAG: hypothetical protein AABX88_02820 [Nanoarchaeota archaeon]
MKKALLGLASIALMSSLVVNSVKAEEIKKIRYTPSCADFNKGYINECENSYSENFSCDVFYSANGKDIKLLKIGCANTFALYSPKGNSKADFICPSHTKCVTKKEIISKLPHLDWEDFFEEMDSLFDPEGVLHDSVFIYEFSRVAGEDDWGKMTK